MPKEVNNAGKDYDVTIVAIVLCAVSTVLVFLRFVEKIRLRAVFAEDYVLIPGFVSFVNAIMQCHPYPLRADQHLADIHRLGSNPDPRKYRWSSRYANTASDLPPSRDSRPGTSKPSSLPRRTTVADFVDRAPDLLAIRANERVHPRLHPPIL